MGAGREMMWGGAVLVGLGGAVLCGAARGVPGHGERGRAKGRMACREALGQSGIVSGGFIM